MTINIQDIIYYGREYTGQESEDIEKAWWFDKNTYTICNKDILINEYHYEYDLMTAYYYDNIIPLFSVDIIKLKRAYIQYKNIKELSRYFKEIEDSELDVTFNRYADHNPTTSDWWDYEKNALKEEAVKWCKENNIVYKL